MNTGKKQMVESFDGYSKIDQQCNLGYEISNMTTNEICYNTRLQIEGRQCDTWYCMHDLITL